MSKHDMEKIYDSMYRENERYARIYNMASSTPDIPINVYLSKTKIPVSPNNPSIPREAAKHKI